MSRIKKILLVSLLLILSIISVADENIKFSFISNTLKTENKAPHQIDLNLSNEVQQAINNGVEISIISNYASAKKLLFWHRYKSLENIKFQLRRHALSNRYMVTHTQQQRPRVFRLITEAMQYISFTSLHTLESLQKDHDSVAARIYLNKLDLPGSLRPKSFLSSTWTHNTGWKIWNESI